MAVIGAGESSLEGRVRQSEEAEPGAGDQKMNVTPFVVHILDAVAGGFVLHAGPRHLAPPPPRLAAGEGFPRVCLTQHPPVELGADPIMMETVSIALA